jgi:methionyl-tRNA formyltransferase
VKIQILIDNKNSWIVPFAAQWVHILNTEGVTCNMLHEHNEVVEGDILCLLGCEKKFNALHLNKFNLVVHESDLPLGRGMSPFTWQVVEGKKEIVVSLLEARDEIDAGVIYEKITVKLNGDELVNEWRELQANATIQLIQKFISKYPNILGTEQIGEATYYRKRNHNNSKLDIDKSIAEQFNLLRVVDNERYPAWFEMNGIAYELKISKKQ